MTPPDDTFPSLVPDMADLLGFEPPSPPASTFFPHGAINMRAPPDIGPAPAVPPSDAVLREDAERLFAQRIWALSLLLDRLEEEGVAAIAAAVAAGDESRIASADPQMVHTAFLTFAEDFGRRIEEAATIPEADLAAAVARCRRVTDQGRR